MLKIDMREALKQFNKEYEFLYESKDNVVGYPEAVEAYDHLYENPEHLKQLQLFSKYRGDFIASDREAAAYMFMLEHFGAVEDSYIFKTSVNIETVEKWIIDNFYDEDYPDIKGIENILSHIRIKCYDEVGSNKLYKSTWERFKYWSYGLPSVLNTSDYLLGGRAPELLKDWTGSSFTNTQADAELCITMILYRVIYGGSLL